MQGSGKIILVLLFDSRQESTPALCYMLPPVQWEKEAFTWGQRGWNVKLISHST